MKKTNILGKILIRKYIIFLFIVNASILMGYGQFIQVKSILIDPCGNTDGQNEMVYFSVGSSAINVADIRIDGSMNGGAYQNNKWPNTSNSFLGWITPSTVAYTNATSKISQINSTLTNCGKLIIPTGGTNNQGLLPGGSRGLIITSTDFTTFANIFATLNDTLYILFQNPGNTNDHFVNYSIGTGLRSLRLTQISSGQTETVTYDKALLINQSGANVAQDGAGVEFTDAGVASYFNKGCVAPCKILYASWSPPTPICQLATGIDLNSLLSDTSIIGGTWSGNGVTGNIFNPNGLSGNIPITYSFGTSSCAITVTHPINVIPTPNASWTPPIKICGSSTIQLSTFLDSGTTVGGVWTGPGVSGTSLNTYLFTGDIVLTYTVGTASNCITSQSDTLTIIPSTWALWGPPAYFCETDTAINLNSFLGTTTTHGGIWIGQGVTDSIFNPYQLSGDISINYSIGIEPCVFDGTHIISIINDSSSNWTPPDTICDSDSPIILDNLLSDNSSSNGNWTGLGVTNRIFRPDNLTGNISITYSIGSSNCFSSRTHIITVTPTSYANWNPPTSPICQHSSPINLTSLLADSSTQNGNWSGQGIFGSYFNPAGLNGTYTITYAVGISPCNNIESHTITVIPSANPTWTPPPTPICENAPALNLTNLFTNNSTSGGDWSGSGVAGNLFYPTDLSGPISITYTVGDTLCLLSQTHQIMVISTAIPNWISPDGICESSPPINLNTLLTDSATHGGTWSGQGVNNGLFNPDELSGSVIVTYTVGTNPCVTSESHSIPISPPVDGSWAPFSSICSNAQPIDLTQFISGTFGGSWSGSGVSNSQFNPTNLSGPITITYTVHNDQCTDSVSFAINVIPAPIASINNPPTICISDLIFDLNSILTGTQGGTWSGDHISSNIINLDSTGNPITVSYIVGNSYCADSLTALLNFGTVDANFELSPSYGFAPLDVSTTNLSSNAISYFWTFGNGLTSYDFEPTPRFLYEGTYIVWLNAISIDGCKDSTFKEVTTVSAGDFIPNSFSPNNDGINDSFHPVITKYTDEYQFTILDRWGKVLYETKTQTDSWNGTSNNEILPIGVYIYMINFKSGKNYYYYNGTITLIK